MYSPFIQSYIKTSPPSNDTTRSDLLMKQYNIKLTDMIKITNYKKATYDGAQYYKHINTNSIYAFVSQLISGQDDVWRKE